MFKRQQALTRQQAHAVYRGVLGRAASDEEIDGHLAAGVDSIEGMVRLLLDSEEFSAETRRRARRQGTWAPTHANLYHPDLARFYPAPGTRSDDGVAIVGREGWLFLYGGNNDLLRQYRGAYELASDWLERWRVLLDQRVRAARELGAELAMVMLPDKLAVYEHHFPEPIERVGPSPVDRLLADAGELLINPLAELRAAAEAGEEVFLRTDSHFSFRGSALVATQVMAKLGAPVPDGLAEVPLRTHLVVGDLGGRFDPPLVGPFGVPGTLGEARIVEDNRAEIDATGGHLGTRRVFVNERAPDPRVLVVFGGSASFAGPDYIGLCWFYAQVFREVHFVWFPLGWDEGYLRRVGAEAVVLAGGDRLVIRLPREDVDTAALAADTLREGRPVGVERVLA